MKLYDSQMAPNPRRVRVFLAEKAIEVPVEQVDLGKQQNSSPEFLAINPLGRVPVLELDDGTHLAESVAICRYFEETTPEPPLFGVGAQGRRNAPKAIAAAGRPSAFPIQGILCTIQVAGCGNGTTAFAGQAPRPAEPARPRSNPYSEQG